MPLPSVSYVGAWLFAFGLTVAAEVPFVAWFGRRAEPRARRLLALALFANLASHPAVWFVFPVLGLAWAWTTLFAECWAWLLEAAFYRLTLGHATWRGALVLSLGANLLSFGLGLGVWALGGLRW